MIYVDRKKNSKEPPCLKKGSAGRVKELAAVLAYFKAEKVAQIKGQKIKKPVLFKLYSESQVKDELRKLFNGKCAYCEVDAVTGYIGDIEHFRPKSEVKEAGKAHRGYYWLAADWENLLFSCRNCNQVARHEMFGKPYDPTDPSMGKMNQFPLTDESKRIKNEKGRLATEEKYRLLINPCKEDPEQYLAYDEKNGAIKPKRGLDKKKKEMADTSIKVFVLQRSLLVKKRRKKLIDIQRQIERVEDYLTDINNERDTARKKELTTRLEREIGYLKEKVGAEEEFTGMARQVINTFLRRIKRK